MKISSDIVLNGIIPTLSLSSLTQGAIKVYSELKEKQLIVVFE